MSNPVFLQLLAGLKADFLADLGERCQLIEALLLQLEKQPDNDTFEQLFREIHSLKGSGGTHGVAIVTNICHLFEDYLTQAQQQWRFDAAFVKAGLHMIDMLRGLGQLMQDASPELASIEQQLASLRQRLQGKQASILIVETSKSTVQLLGQLLSPLGHRLIFCDDSLHALGRLLHENVDVLILAGAAKPLGANALLAALHESPAVNAKLAVIVLTSDSGNLKPWPMVRHVISRNTRMASQLNDAVNALTDFPAD